MKTRKILVRGTLLGVISLGLLLTGCSQFNPDGNSDVNESINAPSSSSAFVPPPFDLTRYEYPQAASEAPDGYQLIQLGMKVESTVPTICGGGGDNDFEIVEPVDSLWAGKYVQEGKKKKIKLDKNEIVLEKDCVPFDSWITMTKPVENEPWVEFEPHGMVFDQPQTVEVTLYYEGCELPAGVEPEDLEVFYWNEELEEYEYIGGYNDIENERITFFLDHFSRYVIASNE